jgi:hypothetical protein
MYDTYILFVMFVLHWMLVLAFITYFIWSKPIYDKYYLILWILLVLQWLVLGDCIISKIEKNILYKEDIPKYSNPSMQFYKGSTPLTLLICVVVMLMFMFNLGFALLRIGVNIYITLTVCILFLSYIVYYRYQEYILISTFRK